MDKTDIDHVREHLQAYYEGVFTPQAIEDHVREYIDLGFASNLARFLVTEGHRGAHLLDIGCGYGSNVLAAREAGIDAVGIEIAPFEVDFARKRLRSSRPQDDPETVYTQGDGTRLPFDDGSFGVVTLMNVLEHVPDYLALLDEATRVLTPDGSLYIVCPNYAAFRREAHYHLPWIPLLPRHLASLYLRLCRRNPWFFEQHIHYCTNLGVRRTLIERGFFLEGLEPKKLQQPELIQNPRVRQFVEKLNRSPLGPLFTWFLKINSANPFKSAVNLHARRSVRLQQD